MHYYTLNYLNLNIISNMELINILIKQPNYCFLCFKEDCKSVNLEEILEIHDQCSIYNLTLKNIVKYLFPFYEIITNEVCNTCCDLILKIYHLIKSGFKKILLMDSFIKTIFKQTSRLITGEKLYINLNKKTSSDVYSTITQEKNIDSIKEEIKTENSIKQMTDKDCNICGKKFKSTKSLNRHLNIHNSITCPYCQKSLKNNSHYKIHLKNHKKPLKRNVHVKKCSQCNYETSNKSCLQSHINKHHLKIKPYVCDLCQKAFYNKYHLIEHLKTHQLSKKLICEVCGEHFSYKKTLENHLTLHRGQRPYLCNICGQSFVTVSRKNEHVKRKHSVNFLSCSICLKKFSLQKELNRHYKNNHSK